LPQSPEKSLDVGQLTAGLSDLSVSWVFLEHRAVGFPEVAEALALAVALRNPPPEPGAGLGRAVPDHERYNLTGPTTESYPQPSLIRPLPDICPALIEFKDIVLLG